MTDTEIIAVLRTALNESLSALEERAIDTRAFYGAEDKYGLAAEAERIYEQAKAALSHKAK